MPKEKQKIFQLMKHCWSISSYCTSIIMGFPDSSAGKESTCTSGDPSLIPGSGRSAGEGISYPFQYSGLENSMDYTVHGGAMSRT